LLNAWCRERKLPLPYYKLVCGTNGLNGQFKASAVVRSLEGPSTQLFSIRVEAEQKAAELFLRSYGNKPLPFNVDTRVVEKVVVASPTGSYSMRQNRDDKKSVDWVPDSMDGFNYKTQLNEYCNANGLSPVFATFKTGGTPHMPQFESTLTVGETKDIGRGNDKKHAEQAAAKKVLHLLGQFNF